MEGTVEIPLKDYISLKDDLAYSEKQLDALTRGKFVFSEKQLDALTHGKFVFKESSISNYGFTTEMITEDVELSAKIRNYVKQIDTLKNDIQKEKAKRNVTLKRVKELFNLSWMDFLRRRMNKKLLKLEIKENDPPVFKAP